MERYAIRYKESTVADFEVEAENEQEALERFKVWRDGCCYSYEVSGKPDWDGARFNVRRTMDGSDWCESSMDTIPLEDSTAGSDDVLTDAEWARMCGDLQQLKLKGFVVRNGDVRRIEERECSHRGFSELARIGRLFCDLEMPGRYAIVAVDEVVAVKALWEVGERLPSLTEREWLEHLRCQLLRPEVRSYMCDRYASMLKRASESEGAQEGL